MNNFKETISRLARFSPQHGSNESMPGYLHHLLGLIQWREKGWTAGAVSFEMPLTGEIPEFTAKGIKAKSSASPKRRLVKYGGISDEGLLFPDTQVPFLSSLASFWGRILLCHVKEMWAETFHVSIVGNWEAGHFETFVWFCIRGRGIHSYLCPFSYSPIHWMLTVLQVLMDERE